MKIILIAVWLAAGVAAAEDAVVTPLLSKERQSKTKTNPIGVAEYQLQPSLPAKLRGRLPTARQLADALRDAFPARP